MDRLIRLAFLIFLFSSFLVVRAGSAQTNSCFNPSQFCEPWWDGSQTINNPDCIYYPGTSFLLSTTPSSGPAEGIRNTGVGEPCGITKGIPAPCGVQTSTNTCSESTGPPTTCQPPITTGCCEPTDPTCCDPFSDPTCGGGDPGGGCGDDNHQPCDDAASLPGLVATLRNAVLTSPLPQSVSTLLQELAAAPAVYISAQVKIVSSDTVQTGSYEYWERDGNYRLRLGSGLNYPMEDVAFDGRFLQGRTNHVMAQISRGDSRLTPFPDGPLTLALAPLRVADPTACPLCQLRLADLAQAVQWQRKAAAQLEPAEHKIGTGSFDAGAQRMGDAAAGRLLRLVWPADRTTGQHLEITLSNYQPVAGISAMFPRTLTERVVPNGTLVQYTIDKIDLSSSFQDDVFDIYSTAPKLAFLAVDKDGILHKRFLRYVPSLTGPSCSAKTPPAGQR
jgi:hypothetical protein